MIVENFKTDIIVFVIKNQSHSLDTENIHQ
jgi:hypothetical protein